MDRLPSPPVDHLWLDRWSASTKCAVFLVPQAPYTLWYSPLVASNASSSFSTGQNTSILLVYISGLSSVSTSNSSNSSDYSSGEVLGLLICPGLWVPCLGEMTFVGQLQSLQPMNSAPYSYASWKVLQLWSMLVTLWVLALRCPLSHCEAAQTWFHAQDPIHHFGGLRLSGQQLGLGNRCWHLLTLVQILWLHQYLLATSSVTLLQPLALILCLWLLGSCWWCSMLSCQAISEVPHLVQP